ncbi:MAG: alpha/beta fold hydrolase [Dialister sp.]|nr:alpha/beta fold hydrolase [Dialister sp.]
MMRFVWNLCKTLCLCLVLLLGATGLYAGNMAYDEIFNAPWDKILGIENRSDSLTGIHAREERQGWERVGVTADDGTALAGTFIEDANPERPTVILLHGMYQNRSMSIPYARLYRNMGYNVLLADLRGHGESGGKITDWGVHGVEDIQSWVNFIHARRPDSPIGLHGISLGAASALIYLGSEEGQKLAFCISDSAYGNLLELGRNKLKLFSSDERLIFGMDLLNPFFQAALFYHTGRWLSDIDPVDTVPRARVPVLFIHGGKDMLIPADTCRELANAAGSSDKEVHIFEGATHANALAASPKEYQSVIARFLQALA